MALATPTATPGSSRRLLHNAVVVRQGEVSTHLFLVRGGLIRLSSVTSDGREIVVALLGPGQVFGENALLEQPSTVEARAVGAAEILGIDAASLDLLVRRTPGSATELIRLLAARLHQTSRVLGEALSSDVPTRVSQRLRDLADEHGTPTDGGVRIEVHLTQDELARMVGASREAVNRSLRALAARDLVRTSDHTVVLPDPKALGPR